jgi:endogenous inhibitor of DNA gyrase (YacG/DUF329 family)
VKLTATELAYVRSQGLYITEKCDGCGKLLNQTVPYMIAGRPEVFCSAECRDKVFFADPAEAKKRLGSRVCASCGTSLQDKNHGALYCSNRCRMRGTRKQNAGTSKNPHSDLAKSTTSEPQKGLSIPTPVQTESSAVIGAKREIGCTPARGGER